MFHHAKTVAMIERPDTDAATEIPVLTDRLSFPPLEFDTSVPAIKTGSQARESEPLTAEPVADWPSPLARDLAEVIQGPVTQQIQVVLEDLIRQRQAHLLNDVMAEVRRQLPALIDTAIRDALRDRHSR